MSRGGLCPIWRYLKCLALFRGRWFQWPLVEAVMWGMVWCLWAVLRFFRIDRGQIICERGIEHIKGSEKKNNFIRFSG